MGCLSIEEQETCISMMRDSKKARVYTTDKTMMTTIRHKLEAKDSDWELIETHKDRDGDIIGITCECPKKCISLRAGMVHRIMTDEQKQQAAERMKNIQKEKQKKKKEAANAESIIDSRKA